jgi:ribonuclease HI
VDMVYKVGGKVYRACTANLSPFGEPVVTCAAAAEPAPPQKGARVGAPPEQPAGSRPGTIQIWTDGACLGNPGPTGAAAIVVSPQGVQELGRSLGHGTNNIGELTAIRIGLEALGPTSAEVLLYTDSSYSLGVLTKPWKPKKNQELIAEIKQLMRRFPRLRICKVAGHAGVALNERVDELASEAARSGQDHDQLLATHPAD